MNRRLKKRSKIKYIPGIISLVCLPILCFGYFFIENAFVVPRAMKIRYYNEKDTFKLIHPGFRKIRKYNKIIINGDEKLNNLKFNKIQKKLRSLNINQDTINGVHISFTNDSKYESFVKALDLVLIEQPNAYVYFENEIWILNFTYSDYENKEINSSICGTAEMGDPSVRYKYSNRLYKENENYRNQILKSNIKYFFIPIILLFAMAFFAFQKRKINN